MIWFWGPGWHRRLGPPQVFHGKKRVPFRQQKFPKIQLFLKVCPKNAKPEQWEQFNPLLQQGFQVGPKVKPITQKILENTERTYRNLKTPRRNAEMKNHHQKKKQILEKLRLAEIIPLGKATWKQTWNQKKLGKLNKNSPPPPTKKHTTTDWKAQKTSHPLLCASAALCPKAVDH